MSGRASFGRADIDHTEPQDMIRQDVKPEKDEKLSEQQNDKQSLWDTIKTGIENLWLRITLGKKGYEAAVKQGQKEADLELAKEQNGEYKALKEDFKEITPTNSKELDIKAEKDAKYIESLKPAKEVFISPNSAEDIKHLAECCTEIREIYKILTEKSPFAKNIKEIEAFPPYEGVREGSVKITLKNDICVDITMIAVPGLTPETSRSLEYAILDKEGGITYETAVTTDVETGNICDMLDGVDKAAHLDPDKDYKEYMAGYDDKAHILDRRNVPPVKEVAREVTHSENKNKSEPDQTYSAFDKSVKDLIKDDEKQHNFDSETQSRIWNGIQVGIQAEKQKELDIDDGNPDPQGKNQSFTEKEAAQEYDPQLDPDNPLADVRRDGTRGDGIMDNSQNDYKNNLTSIEEEAGSALGNEDIASETMDACDERDVSDLANEIEKDNAVNKDEITDSYYEEMYDTNLMNMFNSEEETVAEYAHIDDGLDEAEDLTDFDYGDDKDLDYSQDAEKDYEY